jgi:hypothetical protein
MEKERLFSKIVILALFLFLIPMGLSPVIAVGTNPAADCSSGATCRVLFTYAADDYFQWSVPRSDTYTLEVWGAAGGGGVDYYGTGGKGGYASGQVYLTSGTTLYVYPGGKGFLSSTTRAFNGGGKGDINAVGGPYGTGYTGGGATHIARSVGTLNTLSSSVSNVLIVAGGGGGAAGSNNSGWASLKGNGGSGGGSSGSSGTAGAGVAGTGGTQISGGTSSAASSPSGFGIGADSTIQNGNYVSGGGGGGGFYGGGSGSDQGGGGGGGSGYVGSLRSSINTDGGSSMPNPAGGTMTGNSEAGYARISYAAVAQISTVNLATAGNVSTAEFNKSILVTATTNVAGKVLFKENNRKIAGCINKLVISTTVTCNWKPKIRGSVTLTATFVPTSISYSTSNSPGFSIFVTSRTTPR